MGLSPKCSKIALETLQNLAPEFPIVYATRKQKASINKMEDVIIVADQSVGGTEAIFMKIMNPTDEMIAAFQAKEDVIINTPICKAVDIDEKNGLWHLGWA